MRGYWLYDHQEVGSSCTLFSSQKGYQATEMAANMHSFYSVITFHALDNPLRGQQLQTHSEDGGRKVSEAQPVMLPLRIGNPLPPLILEAV